jgi:anti-sigma B factor antagonist
MIKATVKINIALTIPECPRSNNFSMPQEPLVIEDIAGAKDGQRILRLAGPLVLTTLFDFQSRVRTDNSQTLMLDLSQVPYVDSAGIGALVGAYVTHQKDGRSLYLIGVNQRVLDALQVTRVKQFFQFVDSVAAVEQAS